MQATIVISPLIPKPQGGRRPIGVLSAWERLWLRVHREIGRELLRQYIGSRPLHAARYGQTAALQRSTQGPMTLCGVTVLLDMSNYFR